MGHKVKQTTYEPVEVGLYRVRLNEYDYTPEGKHGAFFKLYGEITEPGEYQGRLISWICSETFSNWPSKLYSVTKAAYFKGGEIPADYDFDMDDIMGQELRVFITPTERDGVVRDACTEFHPVKEAQPALPLE